MRDNRTSELRVFIECEDGAYVAQCMDYDIVGIGKNVDDAIQEFIRAFIRECIVAQQLGRSVEDTPPPPEDIAAKWTGGVCEQEGIHFEIPAFEIHRREDVQDGVSRSGRAVVAL